MLRRNQDKRIAAYVVWVPELRAQEGDVPQATALVPDERARQFWNASESLGKEYERILGTTPEPAWDVYLLFGKRATWKGQPPHPDFWMHQLAAAQGRAPELDGTAFAAEAARLLNS